MREVIPASTEFRIVVQGYLAHKNPSPSRTLQWPYALGPMVILGGESFFVSEVPLYRMCFCWAFRNAEMCLAPERGRPKLRWF